MPSRTPPRRIYSRRARGGCSGRPGSGALRGGASAFRSCTNVSPVEGSSWRGSSVTVGQSMGPSLGSPPPRNHPGTPWTRPPQPRVRARVAASTRAIAATPATRIAASGLVQSMSACPRPAAISRKTRPRPWASSGMARGRRAAAERDRDPEAAEQRHHGRGDARGERRQRPGREVDRHLGKCEGEQGREHDGAANTGQQDPRARRQRRVGERQCTRRSAPREIEQRQPDGGDRVDPRPGGEREAVMDEAVEVQGGRARGAPHEDDHGGEAGRRRDASCRPSRRG